jgi:hypothetical protein
MKNNNSLKNYSILVLVLLILVLIYIHIPNPPSVMRGGAAASQEIQNMLNKDAIYSNTLGHPIMQWVILVIFIILIFLAYQTSMTAFAWTGAPVLGINGLSDSYTISGPGFLKKFYQLTQDTLVLKNGLGGSEPLYPDDMETYKNSIVDFKMNMESQIRIFCNETAPCNSCECPGAMTDPALKSKCLPNVGDTKGGLQANAMRTANAGAAEKFIGIIPKCCCLTKIQSGDYKYVTDPGEAQDFNNEDLWIKNEVYSVNRPREQGYPPYYTYEWKDKTTGLTPGTSDPQAKLHGCDVAPSSLIDSSGNTTNNTTDPATLTRGDPSDATTACTCPDGDPTLNYYNSSVGGTRNPLDTSVLDANKKIIITDAQKLRMKANLFAKWSAQDTTSNATLGTTEKSYRVKSTDEAVQLYDYYFDSSGAVKVSCLSSDGFILAATKDATGVVTCDSSTWTTTDLSTNSNASYMSGKNKYLYYIQNSSYLKPSVFQPPTDFADSIKEQMAAFEAAKAGTTSGFFGGVYNLMFPKTK